MGASVHQVVMLDGAFARERAELIQERLSPRSDLALALFGFDEPDHSGGEKMRDHMQARQLACFSGVVGVGQNPFAGQHLAQADAGAFVFDNQCIGLATGAQRSGWSNSRLDHRLLFVVAVVNCKFFLDALDQIWHAKVIFPAVKQDYVRLFILIEETEHDAGRRIGV